MFIIQSIIKKVQLLISEPSVSVKTESGLLETICAGCGRTIVDKYVMQVAGRNYHEECLSCAACATPLIHSCFIRELKLYCRTDYERIFGVKCARCMEKISCSDFVLRTPGSVFHVECFACCMCGQPLPPGAHYFLRQGQPICRRDYEHELYLNSPQGWWISYLLCLIFYDVLLNFFFFFFIVMLVFSSLFI